MTAPVPQDVAADRRGTRVVTLATLLDEWTAAGVITPAQASRMATGRAAVRVRVGEERTSLLVEAMAYLGGVLVLVACVLLGALWWPDLSTAWRLTLVGGPAAGVLLAGAAVPASFGPAGGRLRVALWLVGAVGAGGFVAVVGRSLDLDALWTTALAASGTAIVALVLWRISGAVLLQLLTLGAVVLAAATTTASLAEGPAAPGVSVWLVAVAWFLLSLLESPGTGRLVRPVAAAVAFGGAMSTTSYDAGIVFALLTVAACVTLALLWRELALLVVGALGLLLLLPVMSTAWFPDTVGAPLVMLVVGLSTVVGSLVTARRMVHDTWHR